MFGSIYVGLSGLTAYSRGLQQVSNNVTNINSPGFKGATVSFTDLVSYDGRGGLAGDSFGGGYGVANGDTRLDFRSGELRQTERDLDLAMSGNGFMMLLDGDRALYTRTGSFEVDGDGHIVLSGTTYRLATLSSSGQPMSVSIDASSTNAPKKTSTITFADNLSSTAPSAVTVNDLKVYDSGGGEHVWTAVFTKSTTVADEWSIKVTDDKGRDIGTQTLKFVGGAPDPASAKPIFTDADNGLAVTFDFSGPVTSFSGGSVSSLRASKVDGHGVGAITAIRVNDQGRLEIAYSNNEKTDLGAIAIADFRDPQALEQRGGGLFVDGGQGERRVTDSADPSVGRVMSRRLEASNVDLAKQFGDLILIQRGFQASSQIISVSNDMIQQLFGIRGQG
jgi:flagellar hook protein FlgE